MADEIFGYRFTNKELLEEALTTPSCRMDRPGVQDNQRLEFLGDSVLGLLSSDVLYRRCPKADEGELTVARTGMVSTPALCAAAVRQGLKARLYCNRGAKEIPDNSKTLADAVEAVIGAAYLDGGFEAAKIVFDALQLQGNLSEEVVCANPKGELQIRAQAMTPPQLPRYELISVAGKSHCPVFTVKVKVDGMGEAIGTARSHKGAEVEAALALLGLGK